MRKGEPFCYNVGKICIGLVHKRWEFAEGGHHGGAIISREPGLGINAQQQRRHIRIADDDLRVFAQALILQIRQQGVGIVAADGRHDAPNVRVADQRVEFLRPLPDRSGTVKIPPTCQRTLQKAKAFGFQIFFAAPVARRGRRRGGGRGGKHRDGVPRAELCGYHEHSLSFGKMQCVPRRRQASTGIL